MSHSAPGAEELTIDELAQRTGMTVRNVRAHQSRGLLPPPDVRGRTGFYGAEHVKRVELIKELQAEGYNLGAIQGLLASAGGSTDDVLDFTRAARGSFAEEETRRLAPGELEERFGASRPDLVARASAMRVLREDADGSVHVRSPRLLAAAQELQGLGIPLERALDLLEVMHGHADGVAQAYVELFVAEVWEPFNAAGRPPEAFAEVRAAFERVRPLAAEALVAVFGLTMADRVEASIADQLGQIAAEGRLGRDPSGRGSA